MVILQTTVKKLVFTFLPSDTVCVCVCEREREREIKCEGGRKGMRKTEVLFFGCLY